MLGFRLATFAAVGAAAAWIHVGSAVAAGYHSPGYTGKTSFGNVAPVALPPVSLGTGKYPNLLVDGAGTAHVVLARDGGASAPDSLSVCNLQRGQKACASSVSVPNPQPPDPGMGGAFSGNFAAGNHDFDGPVPLDIGNQLFLIERRFPDVFVAPTSPPSTSDSNVFEWSSDDGGATITGPGQIGDNQMAGGAIAFGDPSAPSIGTISRTETGGTFFQGSPSGTYTTATAQLGTGDQAYDGGLALDETNPVANPVAAFSDLSGNVFVREYSGQGDVNDPANWSESSFAGFSPQIIGGAAGVFVLSSDSRINGGNLSLRQIVGGQPAGRAVALGKSASEPAISEDSSGRISFAYTDQFGVEVRTSTDGVNFSGAQFAAAIPAGGTIGHLVVAATADGGGFVSFVKNPAGGEGVGQVLVAAFGTQLASPNPGLGPLPGGGVGSAAGDELATSTCSSAKFGAVDAEIYPPHAGCFSHAPGNPNLDLTLGTLNLNGLQIIPDPGVRIGVDPKRHTIDTTGKVKVVLTAGGVNITLWHDALHIEVPDDGPGSTLADLKDYTDQLTPLVQGFPIHGDVDIKLANGGVDIPISLTLPKALGGVTGSATLHATTSGGLELTSLEFKVDDANLGAIELKDVDVSYAMKGNVWTGMGTIEIPAGGGSVNYTKLAVEFDDGAFKKGSLDVGLPYPGIPIDATDPAPQLYLSHVGLGLGLNPLTLSGTAGFGLVPLKLPGEGGPEDYAFRLEAELSAAFGVPVTITAKVNGFLYTLPIANATLVYKLPDSVSLTGSADFNVTDIFEVKGSLNAFVDAAHNDFGGSLKTSLIIHAFGDHEISGLSFTVNKKGFSLYLPATEGVILPVFPFDVFGTISYTWGDGDLSIKPYSDASGHLLGIPLVRRAHAAAASSSFTVPANSPTASVTVHGAGGAPSVSLIGPDGQAVAFDGKSGPGEHAAAAESSVMSTTNVGILNPRPGRWTVVQTAGSQVPITALQYSIGHAPPTVSATVTAAGAKRIVHYRAKIADNNSVTFAEQTNGLLHVIGAVRGAAGTIAFRPAIGPAGRRQLIARITQDGLPYRNVTLGSFSAPAPALPGRARQLRVQARPRGFSFRFVPPANAAHTLVRIVATDGRHLQRILQPTIRGGTVPVVGFSDGITITVVGLRADGARGPSVKASAHSGQKTVRKRAKGHKPKTAARTSQ